ncbi:unnamed protein product [Eruca vesicaria subsp. sativa]|uniref:Agenet domain-containing protein n=1 Tax=Eruca vesicaria subsp. sativa TaxID=29727 RepID=A0ABC8LKI1_ERUVS|nr:unnamed protein product [Eruca vesicaria subsp. sativa]
MSSRRRVISSSSNKKRKKAPEIHLPPFLKPGAAVEISSDESGFRGSWYLGKLVTTVPSDSSTTTRCEVEYTTLFFDKEGRKRLKEVVDVAQLRPPVPEVAEREKRRDVKVGEEVDAFYSDGWWEGTVTEVLGDGRFSVYFRASKEQIRFRRDELRFHREWVNGVWKPPVEEMEEEEEEEEEEDDTEEEEDLLSLVDPESAREIAKQMFSNGTIVEVSSDEEGFKGSWFAAKVVEHIDEDKYLVEYRDLREENGIEPLKEEADFLHIRPPPPSEEDIIDFAVGDKIDAFYNDAWWVGDVIESMKDGSVGIHFRSGEKMRFGRQGLRLHKDWINGTWQLPVKRGETKRAATKVPLRPKKAKAIDKENLSVGNQVEVSSVEEGFEDSWFLAKLIEYIGTDKCLVEYEKLKAEDGKEPLREEVNVYQIRPRPPEMVMVHPFEKLDEVDALYNDGWWVGVVKKVLAESSYLVHFPNTNEVLKFHVSQLRLHQEWIDGKWVASSKTQTV